MVQDNRLYAPAVQRNRDVILAALARVLPSQGEVLEIASGTGEHIVHFAAAFPGLIFQPTDCDPAALASIDAWVAQAGLPNVRPAMVLDASSPAWPVAAAGAILCINMIHISPWPATLGLFSGAVHVLPTGGALVLYGPFRREGVTLAPSNATFDDELRARDPEWGLRWLEDVTEIAAGFEAPEVMEMPANNLIVVYRRKLAG